jgi:hypothetical protein
MALAVAVVPARVDVEDQRRLTMGLRAVGRCDIRDRAAENADLDIRQWRGQLAEVRRDDVERLVGKDRLGTRPSSGCRSRASSSHRAPNTVFREMVPVTIIDWDVTRPGSRVSNFADFLWAFVHPGMYRDDEAGDMLRVAADAYGWTGSGLVDAMLTIVRTFVEVNPEFRDWGVRELKHLERNASLFRERLNE